MNEFKRLLDLLDQLFGPEGCPWDRAQTMETIRTTVLEEVWELIDAIDENDTEKIVEELGDLFLNAAFFCKIGEREQKFSTEEVLHHLNEKLIRRHPHVFGDTKISSVDEVFIQWEKIKRKEKNNHHRKSLLDGIPKHLPSLAKAQKILKKMKKVDYQSLPGENAPKSLKTEEDFAHALLHLTRLAQQKEIDLELALRKALSSEENTFRNWESL